MNSNQVQTSSTAMTSQVGVEHAMTRFYEQSHFWGRLTLMLVILASIGLPMYISFALGAHPGWGPILAGLVGYAAFTGIMWVLEPITYFPVLGTAGTYIAFLSGNIANLCLPCSSAAQKAIGAEPGTQRAEIAGVIGVAIASLTNTVIILLAVLGGAYLLTLLPETIQSAFAYVLPAIYGAVLGQFAFNTPKYGMMALAIGILVFYSPIPSLIKIACCVALTIVVIVLMERAKLKQE